MEGPQGAWVRMIGRFKKKKKEENLWEVPVKPKVTEEEMAEDIKQTKVSPKQFKKTTIVIGLWWLINFGLLFLIILGSFAGMMNFYLASLVLVNFILTTHHFLLILGKVNIK